VLTGDVVLTTSLHDTVYCTRSSADADKPARSV